MIAPPSIPSSRWSHIAQSPVAQFFLALVFVGVPFVAANAVTKLWMLAPELKELRNPVKTAALFAAYWFFVRYMERRPVSELATHGAAREVAAGFGLSTCLIALVVGCLALLGYYHVTGLSSAVGMLQMLWLHLFVAALEEVLFRAVLFRMLEKIVGTWGSLAISTVLFGLAHFANPGANALTLSCLGLLSVCLSLAYLATRRLWLCIAMHWAWNFVQGGIFSLPVSGTTVYPGLLSASYQGPEWATGGAFGVEASAITLALIAVLCAYLFSVAKQRKHFVTPMWKR